MRRRSLHVLTVAAVSLPLSLFNEIFTRKSCVDLFSSLMYLYLRCCLLHRKIRPMRIINLCNQSNNECVFVCFQRFFTLDKGILTYAKSPSDVSTSCLTRSTADAIKWRSSQWVKPRPSYDPLMSRRIDRNPISGRKAQLLSVAAFFFATSANSFG